MKSVFGNRYAFLLGRDCICIFNYTKTGQIMKNILIIVFVLLGSQLKAQSIDQLTTQFNAGHYYTWQSDKKGGQIKLLCQAKFGTLPHNSFYFKVGDDGKQDRLTTKDAMAFVIGKDSFIVIRNIKHGEHELPEDYAHVDAVEGDITIVTHYTGTGSGIDLKLDGLTLYIKKGFTYTSMEKAKKAK
jgi:hypothetical protein